MTDIDPEREWYYSISFHHKESRLTIADCGVITQGDATTRQELVWRILTGPLGWIWKDDWSCDRTIVHQLERNDL